MSFTTWAQAEESFDELLDTEDKPVTIMGIEFSRSRILRGLDPNGYRGMLHDYIDGVGVDSDDLEGSPST